jgi:hypothetical protein
MMVKWGELLGLPKAMAPNTILSAVFGWGAMILEFVDVS